MVKRLKFTKTTALVVGAFVVGGAISGGGTYVLFHDDKNTNQSKGLTATGRNPEDPSFVDTRTNNQIGTLPEGVLDASAVANSPFQYVNKDVKVRGFIAESKPGSYSLVGQDKDKPAGLPIDFGKSNIDPKKYVQGTAATTKQGEQPALPIPVTVSGKIVQYTSTAGTQYTAFKLEVTSVE